MRITPRTLFVFVTVGLVIGLGAGFVSWSLPGSSPGMLRFVLPGLMGAFIGGSLFEMLNIDVGVDNRLLLEIATATAGAIIVVVPAQFIV